MVFIRPNAIPGARRTQLDGSNHPRRDLNGDNDVMRDDELLFSGRSRDPKQRRTSTSEVNRVGTSDRVIPKPPYGCVAQP